MRPGRILAAAVGIAAAAAGPAHAQEGGDPGCRLMDGTAGAPEAATPGREGSPEDTGPSSLPPPANPTEDGLPARVYLKSPTQSRNRRWYFAVKDGRLYVKPNLERTGQDGPWELVSTPACLDGDIREISADDDEVVALDSERSIYTMDQALATPALFNWTSRWGIPFWTGLGFTVPADVRTWAWSVISPREEVYWDDPAGNQHPIGEGKVSHIWSLDPSGQRFSYIDPWLPLDRSYEMCGPYRGRLQASSLSTSGSVVFAMNAFGDLYTRTYDFDISGPDNLFFRYSYEDQRGVADPAIQLPPAAWVQQPKIPGRITNVISIEKVGRGTLHRTLRVEGLDGDGRTGFWEKDAGELDPAAWRFVFTGAPLIGTEIRNSAGDASGRTLGAGEDARYVGEMGEIPDFNIYCSPAVLRVRLGGGRPVDLTLHVVDQIRTSPRGRGLDSSPRQASGTIEVPPASRSFFDGRRFVAVDVFATRDEVSLQPLGWTFRRAAAPPGGVCVSEPGFASASVKPAGSGLAIALRARTESPVFVEVLRGRRVVARFVRVEGFEWSGRVRRGVYVVRLRTLTPGGRLATRLFPVLRRRGRFRSLPPFVNEERCELLRSFSLRGPVFRRALRGSVSTVEAARAVVVLRRRGRRVRRLRLGTVRPERATPFRISTKGLRPGRYFLSLRVRASDGRAQRARLGALRPPLAA